MLSVSQLIAPSKELSSEVQTADTKYGLLLYHLWEKKVFNLVAPRGFEPLLSEPKSNVLPLYNRALNDRPILLLGTSIC